MGNMKLNTHNEE